MINIRFFASLREQLGLSTIKLEYSGQQTVHELILDLQKNNESCHLLDEKNVLVAVNHSLCGKDAKINDGDEVAFFPPVTGG